MSLTAHKICLQCFIQAMYDEGIVNQQFFHLQSMKEVLRRDSFSFNPGYLRRHLIRMYDEGVVNIQFGAISSPRNNRGQARDHAVRLIETYLADVDVILSELSRHVDNSQVDFFMLVALAREIQDKSTSFGAEHMILACFDVIAACEERHKKRFSETLTLLKNEFDYTRSQLSTFVEMERRLIRLEIESSQPPN